MRSAILRLRTTLSDRLLFSKSVRAVARTIKLGKLALKKNTTNEQRIGAIESLCACIRLAGSERQVVRFEKQIEEVISELDLQACPAKLLEGVTDVPKIPKALFLKPWNPSTGEKGVVFISFEHQWVRLLTLSKEDLERFAERYTLVVSPTWTPPHSTVNLLFPRIFPAPVYCLISNRSDLDTFPRLSSNYRMIPLFASNWVDPNLFKPRPREERDIDIVMLANFGTYKRHHVLFRALRDLPESLKVTLIGQPNGKRTAKVLLAEAEAFGVRERIQLLERASDETVVETLCRSKVSLILSRREGSCVAVVEALFADTAVGLVNDAQIGSAAFINSGTGQFLDEDDMAKDLSDFLAEAVSMNPKKWAIENGLSAQDSSAKLNEILKQAALSDGADWESEIAAFHWRPDPQLLNEDDSEWQAKERRVVEEEFGLIIGPHP